MAETYYERLGVDTDASVDAIERAYRNRLKETHPDVSDDPAAAERTRSLIEARRVLTDEDERATYDRLGHAAYADGKTEAGSNESTGPAETVSEAGGRWSTDRDRESGTPGSEASTGSERTAAQTGRTDRERRRRQNRETRADWNTAGGVADGGVYANEWRAWNNEGAYRIHPTDASGLGSRLFPIGPSLVILLVAFGLYPVLLWGSIEPAFPLAFNLVLGACLVVLVGYLISMPPIGVAVFGTWTVVLPAVLVLGFGVAAFSPIMAVFVTGTAAPLVVSVVTWAVLRA